MSTVFQANNDTTATQKWVKSKYATLYYLTNKLLSKQDKPSVAGTAGQILSLDSSLNSVWVDPASSTNGQSFILNNSATTDNTLADTIYLKHSNTKYSAITKSSSSTFALLENLPSASTLVTQWNYYASAAIKSLSINAGSLFMYNPSALYTQFSTSSSQSSNIIYTLPATMGATGDCLVVSSAAGSTDTLGWSSTLNTINTRLSNPKFLEAWGQTPQTITGGVNTQVQFPTVKTSGGTFSDITISGTNNTMFTATRPMWITISVTLRLTSDVAQSMNLSIRKLGGAGTFYGQQTMTASAMSTTTNMYLNTGDYFNVYLWLANTDSISSSTNSYQSILTVKELL